MTKFSRKGYVCESKWSTTIAEFKYKNEGLGNKQPRTGRPRQAHCPLCLPVQPNNGLHLLFYCASMTKLRTETGITRFVTMSGLKGYSMETIYSMYVNGQDSNKEYITKSEYLERGKCMHDMRNGWLAKW